MEFRHYSVLLSETIENLNIKADGIYVDGTCGGGGHSLEIAKRLDSGRLIMFDQDTEALKASKERLKGYEDKITLIHSNFSEMKNVLYKLGIEKVDGIVLDLGVSSYQIDNPDRGFSYMNEDEPLDMRMDQTTSIKASDLLNNSSEQDLYEMLRDYGEEKFAHRIAANIVKERQKKPFEKTGDLNKVILSSIPEKARRSGGNPCKRTYQAVRIKLNRELTVLNDSLDMMIDLLNENGRICIITFHSLEDRIVKTDFRKNEDPCICPPDFPVCVCGRVSKGRVVTRKPIIPSEKELKENKRSKSAHLRVFEKKTGGYSKKRKA
jgi:16S rRNA (cytosine1402-N4)-methyltransferase